MTKTFAEMYNSMPGMLNIVIGSVNKFYCQKHTKKTAPITTIEVKLFSCTL